MSDWLFPAGFPGLSAMSDTEIKTQNLVVLARKYYDGDHKVYLTRRQREWLAQHGETVKFVVNHCPMVVDAAVERLKIIGFDASQETTKALLWDWWSRARMDEIQVETHRAAGRDGEAFIFTDWNAAESRPEWIFHQRYTDTTYDGDGYGMWIEYPNNDYLAKPIRAMKRWIEEGSDGRSYIRETRYYPDRIEKYVQYSSGKFEPYQEEGQPWPVPWVKPDGSPIGIPVAHFHTPGGKSDLKNVIPLQDALNKDWLDILAAADSTGFRMLAFFGWVPTTDGKDPKEDRSNLAEIAPGQVLATTKPDAKVDSIEPSSPTALLDVENRIVFRIATVSKTPLSLFVTSRQVASEGTQKQQEAPLIAKVSERQTLYGNAWEDAMSMAVTLANVFGGQALDGSGISAIWKDPETRNELESLSVAEKKRSVLSVPVEQLLQENGYTPEQIEAFRESPEWEARLSALKLATINAQEMDEDENG